jgi:hypothetical protein
MQAKELIPGESGRIMHEIGLVQAMVLRQHQRAVVSFLEALSDPYCDHDLVNSDLARVYEQKLSDYATARRYYEKTGCNLMYFHRLLVNHFPDEKPAIKFVRSRFFSSPLSSEIDLAVCACLRL